MVKLLEDGKMQQEYRHSQTGTIMVYCVGIAMLIEVVVIGGLRVRMVFAVFQGNGYGES